MAYDLDKILAESNRTPKEVILGGETYELPAVFPVIAGDRLSRGEVEGALALLFGADNVDAIAPYIGVDEDDGSPVLEALIEDVYGLGGSKTAIESRATERIADRDRIGNRERRRLIDEAG